MNLRPVDEARNSDLRGSFQALQRAAQRARVLAAATGTVFVVSRDSVMENHAPDSVSQQAPIVAEELVVTNHVAHIDDAHLEESLPRKDMESGAGR